MTNNNLVTFLGRSPDSFTYAERRRLAGRWIALELYSPENLALRKIEALGSSASECIAALRARGLDPKRFEYLPLV
jgi:hypothetical protein